MSTGAITIPNGENPQPSASYDELIAKRRAQVAKSHRRHRDRVGSTGSVGSDDGDSSEGSPSSFASPLSRRMETLEGKTIKRDRGPHKSRNKSDSSAEDLMSLRERNDLSPRRMEWVKALSKENVELRANLAAEKEKNKQFRTEYATLMAEFTSMKAQLKDALDQLHFYRNSTGSDGMGDIPSPLLSPISVTGSRIAGKDLEIREDENGKRIVTAGKPDGLLNALFDSSNESDCELLNVFLLTHRYYLTPVDLLQKVTKKYHETFDVDVRVRMLEMLKTWISGYGETLWTEMNFLELLAPFVSTLTPASLTCKSNTLIDFLRSNVEEALVKKREKELTSGSSKFLNIDTFPFAGIVLKVNPEEFNLLQLNPVELAKQMTLLEHQHFQAITPLEFLQKNFTKPAKSPNFHLMVAKFNQWSSWATTEILKRETPQQRAEIIGHFITVAQACRDLNNFQSAYAIIGGLNHSALARMKMTWEKVKAKYLVRFRALTDLFNIEQNFKNYRDSLLTCKPPIVPYIGLFPKFLVAIEDGNPDKVGESVNFAKFRMLYRQIQELRAYQQPTYAIPINENIRAFLRSVHAWSEDDLFLTSARLEPGSKTNRRTYNTIGREEGRK